MNIRVSVKLKEALDKHNMTQKELAEIIGIREATISEIANNSRSTINKYHLAKIMGALGITKIEDIINVVVEK